MNNIDIQVVEFGSDIQHKSVELRFKVLREPLGLVYTAEQLEEERDEIHIVAQIDNKITGVLLLKKMNPDLLKMRQVAVDTHFQNYGIGRKMVEFCEQYAIEKGFNTIELHARDTAKDFYLKLDYKISGDEFLEVGIPHFKMEKLLI